MNTEQTPIMDMPTITAMVNQAFITIKDSRTITAIVSPLVARKKQPHRELRQNAKLNCLSGERLIASVSSTSCSICS